MSTAHDDIDLSNARQTLVSAADPESGIQRREGNAETIHNALTRAWGMPSFKIGAAERAVPVSAYRQKLASEPEFTEEQYGSRSPFVAAATAGETYHEEGREGQGTKTRDAIDALTAEPDTEETTRALVDEGVIGAAAPVDVDPVIFEVLNNEVPELNVIESVAQPGFSFKYNVISARDDPIGMLSEAEAAGDLEGSFTPQSSTLSDETLDMKRQVGLFKISDFSQRAMTTLEYMDPRETTLGQGAISHNKFKAKQTYYGDPSVGAGDQSIEDGDAFEGLAKIADDAGNSTDKSTVSSGFLEDLLDELTSAVVNTGLTFDRARFMCSQSFYNAIYDEQTPVIRIDGYDADVEYGPQGIRLSTEFGSAPITPTPNIQAYGGLSGVGSNASLGDVFLFDELAIQYRQLAPMSTVPLGRTGLADRVSMFEYYTLVDRSQGNHTFWLQDYGI